ncbi:MAG TPA: hypothetical protein VJZ27_09175, partial [Aggregatilineales bacterium]|nr:hypothetical protein [Aggregatilineales bacterium]
MLTLLKTLSDINTLKALVIPFRPALSRVVLILIGVIIGILSVYAIPPLRVKFRNAEPVHLSEGYKDQWVKNTAIIHSLRLYDSPEANDQAAKSSLEAAGYSPEDIESLASANESDPAIQDILLRIKDLPSASEADSQQGKISGGIFSLLTPVFCLVGYFFLFVVIGIWLSFVP